MSGGEESEEIVNILELKNLSLELDGKRILNDLSLDIWDGHVHAVVGPNGAGKSTLAYTIMGLPGYRDFDGDILFEGESIRDLSVDGRARKGVTLAWQEPARFEGLTVHEFIRASAGNAGTAVVKDALEKVGLSGDYLARAVDKTLSGGERKKVELASIIAMEPRLVLLDEPDSGIDVESLERIFDAIELFKERGATVVLITHSPTVLEHAEHAYLLCCGGLLRKGPVTSIDPFFRNKCGTCDHLNEPSADELSGKEVSA